ncbi:hypothetical protein [Undibacterium sp. Ren11W]|uniref:hypothetical protein n=1 Tax=Undibacterium sp. Ren11W TaxID=3413045 RepID=UPI003BF43F5D
MKMRTKRRHHNYRCVYNHQLSLVLEAAFAEFKENFAEQGGSLNSSFDSVMQLGDSYRHFKKYAMRFVVAH